MSNLNSSGNLLLSNDDAAALVGDFINSKSLIPAFARLNSL